MEKTLTIDGKKVSFKSTGATPLRYKNQFHRDFLVDILKMEGLAKLGNKKTTYKELQELDTEVFYNLVWVLAKTADSSIPEPLEWLDGFDSFPLMEILPELQDLISNSLQSTKKK